MVLPITVKFYHKNNDNRTVMTYENIKVIKQGCGIYPHLTYSINPRTNCFRVIDKDVFSVPEQIRDLETKMFPEFKPAHNHNSHQIDLEPTMHLGLGYAAFPPSWHFRSGLITEQMVKDLIENQKTLLSVGAGPAHLERLLVELGVNRKNIVLADKFTEFIPEGFARYRFDMFGRWPDFREIFDYIIFPQSIFLPVGVSVPSGTVVPIGNEWDEIEYNFKQGKKQYDITDQDLFKPFLINCLKYLEAGGQIRGNLIQGHVVSSLTRVMDNHLRLIVSRLETEGYKLSYQSSLDALKWRAVKTSDYWVVTKWSCDYKT